MRKPKLIIALACVLVGTNVFTYAATRYWTTKHVLINAEQRLDAALKEAGVYEKVFPDMRRGNHVDIAIVQAGGMYYWWNSAIPYWTIGVILMVFGIAFPFIKPRRPTG